MPYDAYTHWKTTRLEGELYLSVVIPTYNADVQILSTIGAIASHITSLSVPWELIVADDGSTDQTVPMVEGLEFANVRVLKTRQNVGKGSAVRRGMLAARGEYVLLARADDTTPIAEAAWGLIPRLLCKLEHEGYDIAIGARVTSGAQETRRTLAQRVVHRGLCWIMHSILHINVRDTQCGFTLFTREAARHLYSMQIMDYSFDLEMLYLAARKGYKVAEVPLNWSDAPDANIASPQETQRLMRDLLRLKLNDLRGTYMRS